MSSKKRLLVASLKRRLAKRPAALGSLTRAQVEAAIQAVPRRTKKFRISSSSKRTTRAGKRTRTKTSRTKSKETQRARGPKTSRGSRTALSVARSVPVADVFARVAASQKRYGFAKQARAGLDGLWLTGKLSPSEYERGLAEVDAAEKHMNELVDGVLKRGRFKEWNRSERPITTPEQWADAFYLLIDTRNVYERIYRGPPVFARRELSSSGRRELKAYCAAKAPNCGPPCRIKREGVLRRRKCTI
jgi:hypothetical protein